MRSIFPQGVGSGAPKGITAQAVSAMVKAIAGARRKVGLFTSPGIDSSFTKFFTPSARTWKSPHGPTRFGP
jgi:hypothetical protein